MAIKSTLSPTLFAWYWIIFSHPYEKIFIKYSFLVAIKRVLSNQDVFDNEWHQLVIAGCYHIMYNSAILHYSCCTSTYTQNYCITVVLHLPIPHMTTVLHLLIALLIPYITATVFIHINDPGAMHISTGVGGGGDYNL